MHPVKTSPLWWAGCQCHGLAVAQASITFRLRSPRIRAFQVSPGLGLLDPDSRFRGKDCLSALTNTHNQENQSLGGKGIKATGKTNRNFISVMAVTGASPGFCSLQRLA